MGARTSTQFVTHKDALISKQPTDCYCLLLVFFCLVMAGCETTQYPAPVVDRTLINDRTPTADEVDNIADAQEQFYVVQRGDTLYSIALDHGINLAELAEWNNISNPSAIKPGQRISLSVPSKLAQQPQQPILMALPSKQFSESEENIGSRGAPEDIVAPVKTEPKGIVLPYSDQALVQLQGLAHPALTAQAPSTSLQNTPGVVPNQSARIENAPEPPSSKDSSRTALNSSNIDWMWPADGKLLEGFSSKSKGLRIAGVAGQPVVASAAGQVVYSGSGLRGYGKLLIIKHDNTYLSAYAHNSKILVHEGDTVSKGQKIAEMGNSDTDTVKLHFEIRKNGKPVDPMQFLPRRSGSG